MEKVKLEKELEKFVTPTKVKLEEVITPEYVKGFLVGMSSVLMPIPLTYRALALVMQLIIMDIKSFDINFLASVLLGSAFGTIVSER